MVGMGVSDNDLFDGIGGDTKLGELLLNDRPIGAYAAFEDCPFVLVHGQKHGIFTRAEHPKAIGNFNGWIFYQHFNCPHLL
jgi:hypothetical protein